MILILTVKKRSDHINSQVNAYMITLSYFEYYWKKQR